MHFLNRKYYINKMKYNALCFALLLGSVSYVYAQQPVDVYRKPLKEVLTDIGSKYDVRIHYNDEIVKGAEVNYASWRYRSGIEETLSLILYPHDLIWQKTGEKSYQISRFTYYQRPVEEGKMHLERLLALYTTLSSWEKRKGEIRKCILEQLRLSPLPVKTPLNPVYTQKRKMDGYTVANVAIETLPGVYLCGSLYMPAKGKGPFAAILSPHGHFGTENMNEYGRYRPDQQYRCAMLAKMGAVVFSYEMFAWGESRLQFGSDAHRTGLALTMQTLNSIRAVDFLMSLPFVDHERIGVTGESGGGTQTFLLTAIDDRIAVSVPVVMVSSYFYGGCPCESGLPFHSCPEGGTNNAEIAAMASPRPLLVVSDGSDWTRNVPEVEYPYLKRIYKLYGVPENVENVHLEKEGHDYGLSKRLALYDFLARHLGLNINVVRDKSGRIDESGVTIENYESQLVFGPTGKLPPNAVKDTDEVWKILRSLQE